ncbi:hypothetical protein [Parabacteroides sp. AM58-2XD]
MSKVSVFGRFLKKVGVMTHLASRGGCIWWLKSRG